MLRRLFVRLGADRAVVFSALTSFARAAAGLVSLVLIARFFRPEVQGFYYTFASLLALQSFVELGLSLVILNVASHEWSKLALDSAGKITGDPLALSRLAGLTRFALAWFAVAALVFIVGVEIAGFSFFSQDAASATDWRWPWFWVVLLSGLLIPTLPMVAILEGCNQVGTVSQFRLAQMLLATLGQWVAMAAGGGLWVLVIAAGVNLASAILFLAVHYRAFFRSLFGKIGRETISWKAEIWPLQWRIGISGLVLYISFSLFNPVMFHYRGPVAAGQMGMTLALAAGCQSVAQAWLYAKLPRFGMLIAKKDYLALDRVWLKASLVSVATVSIGLAGAWMFLWLLNDLDVPIARRLLPVLPAGLLFLATILLQITQCESAYLRAHKREPLVALGVVSGLTIGLLVWQMGSRFGPIGATASYLGVVALCIVPWMTWIWIRSRAEWHRA